MGRSFRAEEKGPRQAGHLGHSATRSLLGNTGQHASRQRPRSSMWLPLQTSSSDAEHNRHTANCTKRGNQAGNAGLTHAHRFARLSLGRSRRTRSRHSMEGYRGAQPRTGEGCRFDGGGCATAHRSRPSTRQSRPSLAARISPEEKVGQSHRPDLASDCPPMPSCSGALVTCSSVRWAVRLTRSDARTPASAIRLRP